MATTKSDVTKPTVFKKPGSPFNNDLHNNRGGKKSAGFVGASSNQKMKKSVSLPKFKGGSGGDR